MNDLMKLKVLISLHIINLIFIQRQAITIKAIFILLVLPCLDISVIFAVSCQNLLRCQLHPFFRLLFALLLNFLTHYVHLLLDHVVVVDVSFYCYFYEKVFPVIFK